jgi:hypothetical protein
LDFEIANLQLDAGFIEKVINMGGKSDMQGKILPAEYSFAMTHSKTNSFYQAVVLL